MRQQDEARIGKNAWLNRTVIGVGVTSFLADTSHEVATAALPGLVAGMGAGAGVLGLVEGLSDGLSAAAKVFGGAWADRARTRKPIALAGYVVTAVATASIAFARGLGGLVIFRCAAWAGRGVRSPAKKAILAGSVPPYAFGRAFGLERTMDTLGAIVGPVAAALLVARIGIGETIAWTIFPGLGAALVFGLFVREKPKAVPEAPVAGRESLFSSYGRLPSSFRRFMAAVFVFGCGDYARSLLILLAVQRLTPTMGAVGAASTGAILYLLHNACYAAASFPAGALGDRISKTSLLAGGYLIGAAAAVIAAMTTGLAGLAAAFTLAGVTLGIEEALEDSLAAVLSPENARGAAFGTLAAVNGVGDLVASIGLGALWAAFDAEVAFGASAALGITGAMLAARLQDTRFQKAKEESSCL